MNLAMEYLARDFMDGKLSIYCKDWRERKEATQLLVDAGVPHGGSGYSMMFLKLDEAYPDRFHVIVIGTIRCGIEYKGSRDENTIPLQEVYRRYNNDPLEVDEDIFQSFFHVGGDQL